MKVLFFTSSFCDLNHKEFSKDASGFGYMVRDIMVSMSSKCEVYCITHQITKGYTLNPNINVLKHDKKDVLLSCRISDLFKAIAMFCKARGSLKTRLRNGYYYVNLGSIKKAIDNIKPDIVHIQGLSAGYKPIVELCEKMKIPYLVTLHGLIGLGEVNIKNVPLIERQY